MKTPNSLYIRIGTAAAAMGAYLLAAVTLYPTAGSTVLAFAFIPPAMAGWLFGVWGGLLSGILSFPVTFLVLNLVGDTMSATNVGAALTGGSSVVLIGLVVGWIKGLSDRLKRQTVQLEQERKALEAEVRRRTEVEERLIHEALHDPLTDLPNRRLFLDRLQHALAWSQRHPDSPCGLLYLDLNGFKSINDGLGHDAGDQLLIQVAGRLNSSVRAADTAARMGGDEFAVLLDAVREPEEIVAIAERIRSSLAIPYHWNGHTISSSASIGVVRNLTEYGQIDDIMRDADIAMYRAKNGGGDKIEVSGGATQSHRAGRAPRGDVFQQSKEW